LELRFGGIGRELDWAEMVGLGGLPLLVWGGCCFTRGALRDDGHRGLSRLGSHVSTRNRFLLGTWRISSIQGS